MPLGRMVVGPVVAELELGPVVSIEINSDFLEGDTGTVGEGEPAGIEIPTTADVGRVLRVTGPGDGDVGVEEMEEVGGRRRSAHDFLTAVGTGGTWGGTAVASGAEGVEDSTSTSSASCDIEASTSLGVPIVVSTNDSSTERMVTECDGELG